MIAKILNNYKVYYSPVFAINLVNSNSKAVVFDEHYSQLIVVNIYKNYKIKFLFLNFNYENFAINRANFKSYWNNENIFKIIKKKKYTLAMLEEAKKILSECDFNEYTVIQSKFDVEALEYNTGSFHDAYIVGMIKNEETLEVLINTTWGSFVILKCEGIIKNTLKRDDILFYCDMSIDDNGEIEFSFDKEYDENERVLKVKKMKYKLLFDKSFHIKSFDYSLMDKEMLLQFDNKKLIVKYEEINNNLLDLKKRNVIGYLHLEKNSYIECFVLLNDFVISFYNLDNNKTTLVDKFNQLKTDCQKKNMNFDFLYYDEPFTEDMFGEIIHKEEYGKIHAILHNLKYTLIFIIFWNLLWLFIKLCAFNLKWNIYYVFGLGGTVVLLLLISLIYLKNSVCKHSIYQSYLEVREKGLIYRFNCSTVSLSYDAMSNVEINKHIIITTSDDKKYKIYQSKNDEYIYKLLLLNIKKTKDSKMNVKSDL